jgi:hypothetical protein
LMQVTPHGVDAATVPLFSAGDLSSPRINGLAMASALQWRTTTSQGTRSQRSRA